MLPKLPNHRLQATANSLVSLRGDVGVPFAAVALVELRTGLLGLSVSSSGQELRTFHIPESVRKVRPIRKRLDETPCLWQGVL